MNKMLLDFVKFAVKNHGWESYSEDAKTVEVVCAASNLGIIEVSDISNQFQLKSKKKAEEFIAARS